MTSTYVFPAVPSQQALSPITTMFAVSTSDPTGVKKGDIYSNAVLRKKKMFTWAILLERNIVIYTHCG